MSAKRKDEDEARKERVIFLVSKPELEAIDKVAKKEYFGNRSVLIREALIKLKVLERSE
jgi:metal-responsive CopG/Arc/MetJ family transcriptional regulator